MEKEIDFIKNIKYEKSDGKDRVFISYQSRSIDYVLKISNFLEKNNVKTWYAPRNIDLGDEWPKTLCEAIENCRVLLLLYTGEADKSKHVMREVQIADDNDKAILWLKLDNSSPSKTLKYYLSLIQALEWNGNDEEILNILLRILSAEKINVETLKNFTEINSNYATKNLKINQWSKGIYSFKKPSDAGECVAYTYFNQAKSKPNSTLLLPTGRSAKEVFYGMIRLANELDDRPFSTAKIMNDTETFGVSKKNSTSRIKIIEDYLINPLRMMGKVVEQEQLTYLKGIIDEEEPEVEAFNNLQKFPPSIAAVSVSPFCEIIGYDLGMHSESIVFDNPRIIEINDDSKEYIDSKQKTNNLYTVGLKAILNCDILLILAFDKGKANAIERLFKEEIDPYVPITLLRKHKNAYVLIVDEISEIVGLNEFSIKVDNPREVAKCILKQ